MSNLKLGVPLRHAHSLELHLSFPLETPKELVTDARQLGAALAFEDLTNIRESLNQKPRTP